MWGSGRERWAREGERVNAHTVFKDKYKCSFKQLSEAWGELTLWKDREHTFSMRDIQTDTQTDKCPMSIWGRGRKGHDKKHIIYCSSSRDPFCRVQSCQNPDRHTHTKLCVLSPRWGNTIWDIIGTRSFNGNVILCRPSIILSFMLLDSDRCLLKWKVKCWRHYKTHMSTVLGLCLCVCLYA